MPEYYYSPHTGEHIETATPADWMGRTDLAPPPYDKATQSAVFRGGAWVVETADPTHAVPFSVSRFQARMALRQAGLFDAVEAMMAHPDTPIIAVEAWQAAQEFRRISPTIAAMGQALGLTDEQLDDLFIVAGGIEA